jgi:hypothetical protein
MCQKLVRKTYCTNFLKARIYSINIFKLIIMCYAKPGIAHKSSECEQSCISDVCLINITYNLVDDYVTPPAVVLELHWALKG